MSTSLMIGTCGWSYSPDWTGVFYPNYVKQKQFLEYYSQVFPTVEIDSSFYHIPLKSTVEGWDRRTSPEFLFSAKLPEEITHKSKLDLSKPETRNYLDLYLDNFSPLEKKGKMLAHLIQLPPSFKLRDHWSILESFLNRWTEWRESIGKSLSGDQYGSHSWHPVVEFRHKSWMTEKTFELLREYHTTYCIVVEPLLPPRMDITSNDLAYIRFHGFGSKPWWNYLFSSEELDLWARKIQQSLHDHPKIRHVAYFNNHFSGNAIKNAQDLLPRVNLKPLTDITLLNRKFQLQSRTHKKISKSTPKDSLDKWM